MGPTEPHKYGLEMLSPANGRDGEENQMSANLKDSNLQMLAVSSEMFAHSQHESLVCGLPLRCPYAAFYRMKFSLWVAKYMNTLLSVSKYVCSSSGRR